MKSPIIHTFDCEPLTVTDGDTIHVLIDMPLPFDMKLQWEHPLRLSGVNCPELASAQGPAARDFTRQWLTDHPAPYTLVTRGSGRDKYGRLCGELRAVDGHCLNDDLLSSGNAVRM
jgi:endonuclease YncB( thermonuclease family)